MNERLTDRARKVLQLSNQEAQRFSHECVGTEHILLGLVKEGTGTAAEVLKRLGIDLRKVRLEVEKIVQPGPDFPVMAKLPPTPRAKKVIELAINEARMLNHNYVGTEHLLLGLVGAQEGVAAQVLMNLGLSPQGVRRELFQILGDPRETSEGESPEPAVQHFQAAAKLRYVGFTGQVRRLVRLANDEARRLNHEFIAPEHILLGLVTQTFGPALEALDALGVDPRKIRYELERLLQVGQHTGAGEFRPLTPQAQKILDYAIQEASDLGHNYVGTAHLLLGILRDQGTPAEVVLNFFGLTLEKTRDEVRRLFRPYCGEDARIKPSEHISNFPEDVQKTVTEMAAQIDRLNQEKEQAVAEQDFERAARLRDQADKIKKQRVGILRQWGRIS